MIKLVLSDMDSTLIPLGAPHVSARTLLAIQAIQAEGIEFAPCTGRGMVELSPVFFDDSRYFKTGILSSGKKVYVDGRVVEEHLLDRGDLLALDGIVRSFPGSFLGIYPNQTRVGNPVWCVGATQEQMARFGRRFGFTPVTAREVPDVPVVGCTLACDGGQEVLDQIKARAAAELPGLDVVQQYPGWCDVMPHGVNKASGLGSLAKALGVSRDEIVFFGDNDNDVQMLEAVPNGVAVANAKPSAAAAARWHVGACEDDGVAEAMEQIAQAAHTGGVPAFMQQ